MNQARIDELLRAVLYEGYLLYPYRASSAKNCRERFTFGRIYPHSYSVRQGGLEPCCFQCECLLCVQNEAPELTIRVYFLQPVRRESDGDLMPRMDDGMERPVESAWIEGIEREVKLPAVRLPAPTGQEFPFCFPGDKANASGLDGLPGTLEGKVTVTTIPVSSQVLKVRVTVWNLSAPAASSKGVNESGGDGSILLSTLTSTQILLQVSRGAFLSIMDPPAELAEAAAHCKNIGLWPVLVGEEPDRDAMLASPIILYDYPRLANESPGDLFDNTEIDEILSLRIRAMTDSEKAEMRQVDARARQLLNRTEALSKEEMLRLHGVLRKDEGDGSGSETMQPYQVGDRVVIRPKRRADVLDLALAGKAAIIEAVEQDAEGGTHLALVLEEDPGRDLGMQRQPGHRFFYRIDEVELLEATR